MNLGNITWINFVMGVWISVAPIVWRGFELGQSGWRPATLLIWHDVLVGLTIASLALLKSRWARSINIVLGLWLIAAPFLFLFHGWPRWNDVISGAIVAVVAYWALQNQTEESR